MFVETPPPPPNIILIIADDMGACDLGFYGNLDASTPNLDALAGESLRHEAFYVSPVCAPTRASLLTGRHYLRSGVSGVHGGKDHLSLEETTMAEVLHEAGYATGIWGKWHSGLAPGYLPHERGFDEAFRLGLYRHRDPFGTSGDGERLDYPGRWADDVIVEQALDFARRHKDQPFLGIVSSMTPHGPLDAPEDEVERLVREKGLTRNLAILNAQMTRFDAAVGRLVKGIRAIDTKGRETVFIFFSDNGPAMFEDQFSNAERRRRNTLGWRGWKGDVWENGIRSPLFIHWPGRFAAGSVDQPADVSDLLPTMMSWAGAQPLPGQKPMDGRDIGPVLEGGWLPDTDVIHWVHPAIPPHPGRGEDRLLQDEYGPVTPERKAALKALDQVMGVRSGKWKLTRNADLNSGGGPAPDEFLADVIRDPCESTNRIREHAETACRLASTLDRWWAEILADPVSFQQPETRIAAEGPVVIRATSACRIAESLRNDVPAIRGFSKAGDYAVWRIESAATRTVIPQLVWSSDGRLPEGTVVRMSCSGADATGVVQPDGSTDWETGLVFDAGPGTLEFKLIRIDALPAPVDLHRVILSVP